MREMVSNETGEGTERDRNLFSSRDGAREDFTGNINILITAISQL